MDDSATLLDVTFSCGCLGAPAPPDLVRPPLVGRIAPMLAAAGISHFLMPATEAGDQDLSAQVDSLRVVSCCGVPDIKAALAAAAPALCFTSSASAILARRQLPAGEHIVAELAKVQGSLGRRPLWLMVEAAFDCPYAGAIPAEALVAHLTPILTAVPEAVVVLADTSGRVTGEGIKTALKALAPLSPPDRLCLLLRQDGDSAQEAVRAALAQGVRRFATALNRGSPLGPPRFPPQPPVIGPPRLVRLLAERGITTAADLTLLGAASQILRHDGTSPP